MADGLQNGLQMATSALRLGHSSEFIPEVNGDYMHGFVGWPIYLPGMCLLWSEITWDFRNRCSLMFNPSIASRDSSLHVA